jgi:hypothetical protein
VSSTRVETSSESAVHAEPAREMPKGRLGPRWFNALKALVGTPSQRRLARAALQIDRTRHWEKTYERLSDVELKQVGLRLRGRARGGESLDRLLPETFGLVCVAAIRSIGLGRGRRHPSRSLG